MPFGGPAQTGPPVSHDGFPFARLNESMQINSLAHRVVARGPDSPKRRPEEQELNRVKVEAEGREKEAKQCVVFFSLRRTMFH